MKRILACIILIFVMLSTVSCEKSLSLNETGDTTSQTENTQTISFVNKEITIKVGDKVNLLVKEDVPNSKLNWISSDATIAEVTNGIVTGVANGTTTITVQYGDATDTCIVKVNGEKKKETVVKTSVVYKEKYVTQDQYDSGDYWLGSTSIKNDLGGASYLSGKSEYEIQCMINEILARNHYKFQTQQWFNYFSQFSWYTYDTSNMSLAQNRFNSIEKENYNFLADYRDKNF